LRGWRAVVWLAGRGDEARLVMCWRIICCNSNGNGAGNFGKRVGSSSAGVHPSGFNDETGIVTNLVKYTVWIRTLDKQSATLCEMAGQLPTSSSRSVLSGSCIDAWGNATKRQ